MSLHPNQSRMTSKTCRSLIRAKSSSGPVSNYKASCTPTHRHTWVIVWFTSIKMVTEASPLYLGESNIYILLTVFFMPLHSSGKSPSLLIHSIHLHKIYIFLPKCTAPNTLRHLNTSISTGSFAITRNGISHPIIQ